MKRVTGWGRGIRWRLASLYLGLFAVALTVFCALLLQYFGGVQERAFDAALFNFAVDVSANLEMDFVGRLFVVNPNIVDEEKQFPFHLGSTFVEVRDAKGRVVSHSRSLDHKDLPFDEGTLSTIQREKVIWRTINGPRLGVRSASEELRLLTYLVRRDDWREPLILQIAVPLDLPRQERRDLLLFFALAVPGFLALCGIAGIWMSKRALRPVHEITLKAGSITGVENLGERLSVPTANDEIRDLAVTFNGLLDRLQRAFTSQERFVSNASHQLKTPLTILKGELEMLRKSPGDLAGGLASAAVEIDRLIKLVQDLLLLARLEAGRDMLTRGQVRLDEALLKVVARVQRLARTKDLKFTTKLNTGESPDFATEVRGDEDLIESMLENFVENAIKYSPPGQTIEVELHCEPTELRVRIRDHGPGIAKAERPGVFERFTRGKPSNEIPGSGLGLSIAAEIAHLHDATVEISDPVQGGGTVVEVRFPQKAPVS